jgi:hypothetical protein
MIIDFKIHENKFYSIREHQRIILTKITTQGYEFIKNGYPEYIIVTGIGGYDMIVDQPVFFTNFINLSYSHDSELIGKLMNNDFYYNYKLEIDRVILGSTLREVEHYIKTKGRKEKIEKLNDASKISEVTY